MSRRRHAHDGLFNKTIGSTRQVIDDSRNSLFSFSFLNRTPIHAIKPEETDIDGDNDDTSSTSSRRRRTRGRPPNNNRLTSLIKNEVEEDDQDNRPLAPVPAAATTANSPKRRGHSSKNKSISAFAPITVSTVEAMDVEESPLSPPPRSSSRTKKQKGVKKKAVSKFNVPPPPASYTSTVNLASSTCLSSEDDEEMPPPPPKIKKTKKSSSLRNGNQPLVSQSQLKLPSPPSSSISTIKLASSACPSGEEDQEMEEMPPPKLKKIKKSSSFTPGNLLGIPIPVSSSKSEQVLYKRRAPPSPLSSSPSPHRSQSKFKKDPFLKKSDPTALKKGKENNPPPPSPLEEVLSSSPPSSIFSTRSSKRLRPRPRYLISDSSSEDKLSSDEDDISLQQIKSPVRPPPPVQQKSKKGKALTKSEEGKEPPSSPPPTTTTSSSQLPLKHRLRRKPISDLDSSTNQEDEKEENFSTSAKFVRKSQSPPKSVNPISPPSPPSQPPQSSPGGSSSAGTSLVATPSSSKRDSEGIPAQRQLFLVEAPVQEETSVAVTFTEPQPPPQQDENEDDDDEPCAPPPPKMRKLRAMPLSKKKAIIDKEGASTSEPQMQPAAPPIRLIPCSVVLTRINYVEEEEDVTMEEEEEQQREENSVRQEENAEAPPTEVTSGPCDGDDDSSSEMELCYEAIYVVDENRQEYGQLRNSELTRNKLIINDEELTQRTAMLMQPIKTEEDDEYGDEEETERVPGYSEALNKFGDKAALGYIKIKPRTVVPFQMWPDRKMFYTILKGIVQVKSGGAFVRRPGPDANTNYLFGKKFGVTNTIVIPEKTVYSLENWEDEEVLMFCSIVKI